MDVVPQGVMVDTLAQGKRESVAQSMGDGKIELLAVYPAATPFYPALFSAHLFTSRGLES